MVNLACIYIWLGTQLGQWMDYLHNMQQNVDITFYIASAYKNSQKFPIFMLGTFHGIGL